MTAPTKTILKAALLLSPTTLALLLLGAYWLSKSEQANEAQREAPVHKEVPIETRNGLTTLAIDEASQARSGIRTSPLGASEEQAGPVVYGTVIDLQALLDLAARHASNAAELAAANAERAAAQAELKRVQALYEDGQNASLKALGAARVADAAAAAKTDSARAGLLATEATLQQQFGPTLSGWAKAAATDGLAPFAARRAILVRIVFPPELEPAPRSVTILDATHPSVPAQLVSPSPQTDASIQGTAYFYRTTAPLASGTRVTARIDIRPRTGLLIPADAVVWYGGQPWAYVRTAATRFERRAVAQEMPRNGDFLVTNGFAAGEEIVVRGAQLLLSEENRALLGKD